MIFGSKPHITRNGKRADVYRMYKDGSFLAWIGSNTYAFDATGRCGHTTQLDIVGYWAEAGVSENQSQGETPKLEVSATVPVENAKRFQPGVYGILSIAADGTLGNQVLSFTANRYTAEELRQAAATLISMAEGMEL